MERRQLCSYIVCEYVVLMSIFLTGSSTLLAQPLLKIDGSMAQEQFGAAVAGLGDIIEFRKSNVIK